MTPERAEYSRDRCTCGHADLDHHPAGEGRCKVCGDNASWGQGRPCPRYQWDGEPRKRVW